jgi:hypothetical protein
LFALLWPGLDPGVRLIATGLATIGTLWISLLIYSAYHARKLWTNLNISELEDMVEVAEADFRMALREKAVLPTLRAILGEHLVSKSTTLRVHEASGLGYSIDPLSAIDTEAAVQLRSLVEQLPGGSVGITGPRGVGKTSLLHSFCAGLYPIKDQTPTLAVEVSLPVRYAPHEFIVHLFTKLCLAILGPQSVEHTTRLPAAPATDRHRIPDVALWWIGWFLLVASIGVLLVPRVLSALDPRVALGIGLAASAVILFGIAAHRRGIRLGGWLFGLEVGFEAKALEDPPVPRWFGLYMAPSAPPVQRESTTLQALAADRLREIQIQQAIALGWSGGL